MIEVNLLPGGRRAKRGSKRDLAFSLPSLGLKGLPDIDRWMAFIVVAWLIGPLLGGWMFFGVRGRQADLTLSIEEAVQDSARYAEVIAANRALQARRDTIAQKLEIIQTIDAGRYLWPHVMDEVARALPEYTWLTAINQASPGPPPAFHVSGRAGSTFALAKFMKQLEDSPFVRGVRLTSSQLMQDGGKLVYDFLLEAGYETPPPELIQTVPLFVSTEEE